MMSALAALLLSLPACAKEKEDEEKFTASEIASEMRSAEAANLDAALLRSGKEAAAAAENMAALLRSSSRETRAALAELKAGSRGLPLSEEAADLAMSADLMEAKYSEFLAKAASASVRLADMDEDDLLTRRAGYRSKDRARDILRAQDTLVQAGRRWKRKGVGDLVEAEKDLLVCADSSLAEMAEAREHFKSHPAQLETRVKGAPSHREALEQDIDDLRQEKRMLEMNLRLRRYDEEAFNGDFDESKNSR